LNYDLEIHEINRLGHRGW